MNEIRDSIIHREFFQKIILPKEAATGGGGGIEGGSAPAPAAPNIGGTGAPIGGGGCPGCPTNSTGWCLTKN